jgi:hypothetical protein
MPVQLVQPPVVSTNAPRAMTNRSFGEALALVRATPSRSVFSCSVVTKKLSGATPGNRQSEAYAREGIELDVSTLAD